ncbi:MAG: DUF3788 domain-containing protein [Dehalobacterium sp.]
MRWNELYQGNTIPSDKDIEQYIGKGAPLWKDLLLYIEKIYRVKHKMSYSKCAAQPGWNVKFQKSGKSLCTLYPMKDYFIALVVVGAKEESEVELTLETFTPYVVNLYNRTSFSCGGRWLMIEVRDKAALDDVKSLIAIRVKPKLKI